MSSILRPKRWRSSKIRLSCWRTLLLIIFISKYNSTGNKQWSKLFGSNLDDVGNELALDSLSNIYITGYSKGNLDNKTNSGNSDIFISKYNSDGSNQKTELLGTSSDDKAYSVQLDSNNQIYITGYTNGFSSTRDSNIFLVSPILTQWKLFIYFNFFKNYS